MKEENLLNIITITKDDFEGVVQTIKSTYNLRTFHNIKQIIIDSSDKITQNKLNNFLKKEKNIEHIRQEPSGISAAFNLGLDISKSKWIWFLNGKDELKQEIEFEKIIYILEKSSAESIIFQIERMNSKIVDRHPPIWSMWPPVSLWIPQPATIVKRSLFERYGEFDKNYKIAMDGDVWFRFFSNDVNVDVISIPLTLYDEEGISSTQSKDSAKEVYKILRKNIFKMIKLWLNEALLIIKAFIIFYKIKNGKL